MHKFPETGDFGQRMQHAELEYLVAPPQLRLRWRKTTSGCRSSTRISPTPSNLALALEALAAALRGSGREAEARP